jgi:hypothetical protein
MKLSPQPQDPFIFGLLKTNFSDSSSSTKSIVDPSNENTAPLSISTETPINFGLSQIGQIYHPVL